MAGDKKIVCPDCATENASDAERCSKCDLPLIVMEKMSLGDFFRIQDVRDKRKKAEKPEKKGLW